MRYKTVKDLKLGDILYYLSGEELKTTFVKILEKCDTKIRVIPDIVYTCREQTNVRESSILTTNTSIFSITVSSYDKRTFYCDERCAYTEIHKQVVERHELRKVQVLKAIESLNSASVSLYEMGVKREQVIAKYNDDEQ